MFELIKDETKRDLGRQKFRCRICQSEGMYKTYLAREMMYGTKDEFKYFECDNCRCMQIADIPEDLSRYYQEDYYSYEKTVEDGENIVFTNETIDTPKTLDVGCGSGKHLLQLALAGHNNLYGCDPFLQKDIRYGDRVCIWKCDIHSIDREMRFEKIIMEDSFEHVTDPLEVLQSAHDLLTEQGVLEIHIPTYPNIAFELFGPHWFQLDPPRHITLHSVRSLRLLADRSGLKIIDMKYDSGNSQIIRSFFYQHGVPYFNMTSEMVEEYFTPDMMKEIDETVEKANREGFGDHVRVLLTRD